MYREVTPYRRNVPLSILTALIRSIYKEKRSYALELNAYYSRMKADILGDITSIEPIKIIVDMATTSGSKRAHTRSSYCKLEMPKDKQKLSVIFIFG